MAKPKKPKKPSKVGQNQADIRPRARLTYGRPTLSEAGSRPAGRSPVLGIRLPKDDMKTLDAIAAKNGVRRSEMVRRLLLSAIAAQRSGKGEK